jgi:phage baseplate assembly protein V
VSGSISGMNIATLARLIENLIRFGTVAAVQMDPPRVKVQSGNILTTWRPWFSLRAGEDREWDPPTIGEQAALFSPSGNLNQGVALVGLFSDLIPANGERAGLHRRTYRDGAVIEYDSIAKHLRATLPGTAEVIAAGQIDVTTEADLNAVALGDINVNSGGNIQITAAGDITLTGANVRIN